MEPEESSNEAVDTISDVDASQLNNEPIPTGQSCYQSEHSVPHQDNLDVILRPIVLEPPENSDGALYPITLNPADNTEKTGGILHPDSSAYQATHLGPLQPGHCRLTETRPLSKANTSDECRADDACWNTPYQPNILSTRPSLENEQGPRGQEVNADAADVVPCKVQILYYTTDCLSKFLFTKYAILVIDAIQNTFV